MNRNVFTARVFLLSAATGLVALLISTPVSAQEKMKEFFDEDYGYFFKYPASWRIRKWPEGDANKDMRVMLYGPSGSSFMVVAENLGRRTMKEDFDSAAERNKRVDQLMSQTIEQIYRTVSRNMKATDMTIGERRDLSNKAAVKFYISTLHGMPAERPIIVAGIHAFPFTKEHALNFVMTAFLDKSKSAENDLLLFVFNSFRLAGEIEPSEPSAPERKGPNP